MRSGSPTPSGSPAISAPMSPPTGSACSSATATGERWRPSSRPARSRRCRGEFERPNIRSAGCLKHYAARRRVSCLPESELHNMTDNAAVLLEKRGPALWVTINRPDKRNAINADVIAGIAKGYRDAHDDPEVRVIVLTGGG